LQECSVAAQRAEPHQRLVLKVLVLRLEERQQVLIRWLHQPQKQQLVLVISQERWDMRLEDCCLVEHQVEEVYLPLLLHLVGLQVLAHHFE